MPGNDDVVLKLIIRGQDPSEIQRLAAETSGRLAQESAQYINRLTQLHKAAAEEQSAAMKKAIDTEIKESTKLLSAIQTIERQREIAFNKAQSGWRRTLEDMENLTTVTQGAIATWKSFASTVSAVAEEMLKVSQVLNAPGGGSDAFAISGLVGDVSAFDIATVRNKALQQELTLSTQDFVTLTAAASELADQLGTNAKDALETFTDAMATGRTRSLALIGININSEAVYKRLADSIGKTTDQLTEAEKKLSMQKEIMEQVSRKAPEVGKGIETMGDAMERSLTGVTNVWHAFLTSLANFRLPQGIKDLLDLGPMNEEELRGLLGTGAHNVVKAQLDALAAQRKARVSATADSYLGGASQDDLTPAYETDQYMRGRFGSNLGLLKSKDTSKEAESASKERARRAAEFDKMMGKGATPPGFGVGGSDYGSDEESLIGLAGGSVLAGSAADLDKELEAKGKSYEALQAKIREEAQTTADAMGKTMEEVAKRKESVQSRAGGLMYALVFGQDGPSQTYEEMDAFGQATVDMMGMVSGAATQMAEAVGQSLAAAISGSDGNSKSLRRITHDMLQALSAQALVKGLFEVAEGIASAASYNYDAAAKHFAAAAAFGAVGVATGLGARMVGTGSSGASAAPSTARETTRAGGSGYGSGTARAGTSDDRSPLTINLSVFPGGEAEAGRQINKALAAYYSQTGRGVASA